MKRSVFVRCAIVLSCLSCAFILSACGPAKVAITAPTPDSATVALCHELVPSLSGELVSQGRRSVSGDDKLTAAWGDPAITLRCGVPRPAGFRPESSIISVNGIDWFAEQLSAGYQFTSVNTKMFIEIAVPNNYSPEANVLTELSSSLSSVKLSNS